jgi:hypothetical protein
MEERAVSFTNQDQALAGALHLPAGEPPHPCVVFLHDYTGNRIGDHRLFVKAARDLCEHGLACLRFDFRGSGESQGEFAEITFDGEVSDTFAAMDFLGTLNEIEPRRIGIAGLSLGAAVAVNVASIKYVKSLALWAPTAFVDYMVERGGEVVMDPYAWLPRNYQQAVMTKGRVDIGGFVRGKPFFESLKQANPLRDITRYGGPVLMIQGSEDQEVSPVNAELMYDSIKQRRRLIMIDDADHTFSAACWERQVIEATREWFLETL